MSCTHHDQASNVNVDSVRDRDGEQRRARAERTYTDIGQRSTGDQEERSWVESPELERSCRTLWTGGQAGRQVDRPCVRRELGAAIFWESDGGDYGACAVGPCASAGWGVARSEA